MLGFWLYKEGKLGNHIDIMFHRYIQYLDYENVEESFAWVVPMTLIRRRGAYVGLEGRGKNYQLWAHFVGNYVVFG